MRIAIAHRTGRVALGEASVAVAVGSPHRGAAFEACRFAIDILKARSPIWKRETYRDGDTAWIANTSSRTSSCSASMRGRIRSRCFGYEARRPRGVTLVAGHGYSSSKQNLDMLCSFLAGHGFTIYSLDFPGHKLGASGGRLNAATDLTAAMHAVVAAARARGAGDSLRNGT